MELEKQFRDTRHSIERAVEERDACNSRARELIEVVKELRVKRTEINQKVSEAKKKRDANHSEARKLVEKIKKLKGGMKEIGTFRDSSESIQNIIEKLEFEQQTKAMSLEDEKAVVNKIEGLKKGLVVRKAVEAKYSEIDGLEKKIGELRAEAHNLHEQLLKDVEESEKIHQSIAARSLEIDGFRKKGNEAHQNLLKLRENLTNVREKLVEARKKDMERKARELAEQAAEKDKKAKERAEKVSKELKGKKKFNIRDLQVLDQAGEKMPF